MIHITGTNGKTSIARMTESLLLASGLSTGRFTSPHLHDIRERIVLSGELISPGRFLAAYDDVLPYVEIADAASQAEGGPPLSFFEVLVAMAYAAFADAPVDVQVIEVGMGGSWDATNVADGAVAVIGPISRDHEKYLGSDLAAIAAEKAGIIKPGAIAVSAAQPPEAAGVLLARAGQVAAPVAFDGEGIAVLSRQVAVGGQLCTLRGLAGDYPDVLIPLFGEHQAHNALLALTAVEALLGGGEQPLDIDLVRGAFAQVSSPGRAELVRRSPTVLADGAHNPAAVASLVATLADSFTFSHIVGLFAVLADKDAETMLELLEPVFDEIIISRSSSARARDPHELGRLAADIFGEHRVRVVPDLPGAVEEAVAAADAAGLTAGVVATGSVFTAAEVRMLLGTTDA